MSLEACREAQVRHQPADRFGSILLRRSRRRLQLVLINCRATVSFVTNASGGCGLAGPTCAAPFHAESRWSCTVSDGTGFGSITSWPLYTVSASPVAVTAIRCLWLW
jgi:hypothetical protein